MRCVTLFGKNRKLRKISKDEAVQACIVSKALTRYAKLYRVTDLDVGEVARIAVENGITFYDSSYIALARELRAPISSEDRDIVAVAPKYDIRVIRLRELMNLIRTL